MFLSFYVYDSVLVNVICSIFLSLMYLFLEIMIYWANNYFYIVERLDDSERLRPEELNQQNIEALVAESNLVFHFSIFHF